MIQIRCWTRSVALSGLFKRQTFYLHEIWQKIEFYSMWTIFYDQPELSVIKKVSSTLSAIHEMQHGLQRISTTLQQRGASLQPDQTLSGLWPTSVDIGCAECVLCETKVSRPSRKLFPCRIITHLESIISVMRANDLC